MSKSLFNLEDFGSLAGVSERKMELAEVFCALWELSPNSHPVRITK